MSRNSALYIALAVAAMLVGVASAFMATTIGNRLLEWNVSDIIYAISSVTIGTLIILFLGLLIIRIVSRKQDTARREIEKNEFQASLSRIREAAELISYGDEAAVDKLETIIRANPTAHIPNLMLGRVLRHKGELPQAIDRLTRYIEAKNARGERDQEYADAIYNRACYYSLTFEKSRNEEDRKRAIRDLRTAIELDASNIVSGRSDRDFESLKQDREFQSVLQGASPNTRPASGREP